MRIKEGDAGAPDNEDVNDPGKLDDMKKNIEQRANQLHDLEQQLGKVVWKQMAAHQAVAAARAEVASLQHECDRAAELKNDAQRAAAQSKMYQQQLDAANQRCLELQQEIRDADSREADLVRQLQTRELLSTSRRRRQSRSDEPSAPPADPAGYDKPVKGDYESSAGVPEPPPYDDSSKDDEPEYSAPVESKAQSYRLAVDLNKLRHEPSAGEEVLILNKATAHRRRQDPGHRKGAHRHSREDPHCCWAEESFGGGTIGRQNGLRSERAAGLESGGRLSGRQKEEANGSH